ncbi:MAG: asparagine synthase (glutamine-hydrolyzing) [Gemmatimonadaceae bacterium]|nr:asparagine synthase (glutamine-hydrolyzing) [Gemmatimonadaceae bacterium]
MCGFAALAALGASPPPTDAELQAMIRAVEHRGPDGLSTQVDGTVGLAHARLSIIDLEGGWQPIHNEDRSVWVVFNGEIFNYVELRRDLEAQGHRFYTHSDTECIVHLYEQYGDDFVQHLNGQFGIALHDLRRRRLVVARDRVGIRPVFYTMARGRFAVASEVKALFSLPEVPRALDVRALSEILTFWSPLPPRTAFEGVWQLPPGHRLTLDLTAAAPAPVVTRYWDWQFPETVPTGRSEAACAEELHALLLDAVRLQLRADVPVGAYLSGGLDSSIITAIIRRYTETPLRTFSLTFEDAEFDESVHQQAMVDHLGTQHTAIRVSKQDIAAAFPRTVWHTEVPIVRTAPTPLMLLSGHVRASGYTVVLTGEGADEVFGGYDLFREAKIRRWMAQVPDSKYRANVLQRLYPYLRNSPAQGRAFTQAFFSEGLDQRDAPWFAHIPRMSTTQRVQQFLAADVKARVAAWDPRASLRATLPADIDRWIPMGRDQYVEAHTLMSGYLLCSQGDRVAMANSIEGRFPFLDHRLIEFANGLPPAFKVKGLAEKFLLKKAFTQELPASIRTRTKQPYRAPDSASFFVDGRPVDYVAELLSPARVADAGLFDPVAVGKLLEKGRAGRIIGFGDNMAFVGVLSTMLLHDRFVRPATFAAR